MTQQVRIASLMKDGSIKFEIVISVYHPNMTIDNELCTLITDYMVRSGGMMWNYTQDVLPTESELPKIVLKESH